MVASALFKSYYLQGGKKEYKKEGSTLCTPFGSFSARFQSLNM